MTHRTPCPTWFADVIFCGPGCAKVFAEWLMHVLLEGQED